MKNNEKFKLYLPKLPGQNKRYYIKVPTLVVTGGITFALTTSGIINLVGNNKMKEFEKQMAIDETITQAERMVGDNTENLIVSRLEDTGKISYNFNVSEVLTDLKNAKEIYYKYESKNFLSEEEKIEFENAMNTILYCNDKLIEIYNEIVKRSIANHIGANSKSIDIIYNKPNDESEPKIEISINGDSVVVGKKLQEIIISYKQGLMNTYDPIIYKSKDSRKKYQVQKVLNNIPDLRKAINKIYSPNSDFIVAIEDKNADSEFQKINEKDLPNYNIITNPEASSKVTYLDIDYDDNAFSKKNDKKQIDEER